MADDANMVGISADLRKQREDLVRMRTAAMKIANDYQNTDIGNFKVEECRRLDLAIANIDEALKAYE
jgi:hypothetical protein